MISYLCIFLLLPFGGFAEEEVVDEDTENPNDAMTTNKEQNQVTETVTETNSYACSNFW